MPKKRHPAKRPQHRRPEPRRHLHAVPERDHDGDPRALELIANVRTAMRDDTPVSLIRLVSMILEVSDPRGDDPFASPDDVSVPRMTLLRAFIETPFAETTALLTVLAAMLPADDPAVPEIAAELPHRRHPLPPWLRDLAEGRIEVSVMRMTEELGDGENCVLGVRFPSGDAFTTMVFTDHNLGSVVKDAFFLDVPMEELMARVVAGEFEGPSPDDIGPWDPATARATVTRALEQGRRTLDMPESEDWPASRPAVEWLLSLLPDGGVPEVARLWDEDEVAALKAEFLASDEGRGVAGDDDAEFALDMILRFGAGYNVGGPLRWSPVVAEIFLLDWMPRTVVAALRDVAAMPTLLADWVRFAHRREGLDRELTGEVLLVIASMVAPYGEAMRAADPYGGEFDEFDDFDAEAYTLRGLEEAVGGREALAALDADPLPDEEFRWDGIAEDIRERVGEYLALTDAVADEHLDVEHRTAMRRFLALVAVGDPAIFRRRASVERGAAAVAWAIGRANDTVGSYRAGLSIDEMAGWFGVGGSVSQRGEVMLRAIDAPRAFWWGALPLGRADLLVSARRAAILSERERYTPGGGDSRN